jgi:hypothetical protein
MEEHHVEDYFDEEEDQGLMHTIYPEDLIIGERYYIINEYYSSPNFREYVNVYATKLEGTYVGDIPITVYPDYNEEVVDMPGFSNVISVVNKEPFTHQGTNPEVQLNHRYDVENNIHYFNPNTTTFLLGKTKEIVKQKQKRDAEEIANKRLNTDLSHKIKEFLGGKSKKSKKLKKSKKSRKTKKSLKSKRNRRL